MQKIVGVIAVVLGIIVLVWGHQMAGAPGSQVENLATGETTNRSMYVYIAGAALILYGIFRMVWKRK
jgi:predicted phage tail protein